MIVREDLLAFRVPDLEEFQILGKKINRKHTKCLKVVSTKVFLCNFLFSILNYSFHNDTNSIDTIKVHIGNVPFLFLKSKQIIRRAVHKQPIVVQIYF